MQLPDGVMQAIEVNMQFTELDPVYDEDYNAAWNRSLALIHPTLH